MPEVDRVFVCVLSTPTLQAPPPKGDRRAVASPPPSPYGYSLPAYRRQAKGDRKAKDRNTPPRQAKPATPQEGNLLVEITL